MTLKPDGRAPLALANWPRLRRFFHLEGNLAGVHYEARLGIFDLNAGEPVATDITAIAPEQQAWESEGGAQVT